MANDQTNNVSDCSDWCQDWPWEQAAKAIQLGEMIAAGTIKWATSASP